MWVVDTSCRLILEKVERERQPARAGTNDDVDHFPADAEALKDADRAKDDEDGTAPDMVGLGFVESGCPVSDGLSITGEAVFLDFDTGVGDSPAFLVALGCHQSALNNPELVCDLKAGSAVLALELFAVAAD